MVKRTTITVTSMALLRLLSFPLPAGGESAPEMVVEGVAADRQAAPVAALREIRERLKGLQFAVYDGKYTQVVADGSVLPLETRDKETLEVKELKSGLFKALLKIKVPEGFSEWGGELRERAVIGEAEIKPGGSLLAYRDLARQDALEKAITLAMEEQFPGGSAPYLLTGRVLFLGTVEEDVRDGLYRMVALIKVSLDHP